MAPMGAGQLCRLLGATEMTETPYMFGPERKLLGILASPDSDPGASVACLLLNVGVTHRVGPRRLNVKWARQLAAAGIPSLRFDLSGIGDSLAAGGRNSFREQALLDMRAAMDVVENSLGVRRFVVLGVCSGAANGYWLAKSDARVVGLLMFDGFTFPTFKTQVLHDWRRFRTTSWTNVIRKGTSRIKRLFGADTAPKQNSIFNAVSDVSAPTRLEFQQSMESLTARGVSIYLIYSGSLLLYHNYADQLLDAFKGAKFLTGIKYSYMPSVDHIATDLQAQHDLTRAVKDWVSSIKESRG